MGEAGRGVQCQVRESNLSLSKSRAFYTLYRCMEETELLDIHHVLLFLAVLSLSGVLDFIAVVSISRKVMLGSRIMLSK